MISRAFIDLILRNISTLLFEKSARSLVPWQSVGTSVLARGQRGGLSLPCCQPRLTSASYPLPKLAAKLTPFCMFIGPYEVPARTHNFLRFAGDFYTWDGSLLLYVLEYFQAFWFP